MSATLTTIANFPTSTPGTNGTTPDGELFMDSSGNLIGATAHGGANGIGTTYEIAKIGAGYATTPTFLDDIPTGLNTLLGVPNLSADASGDLFGLMFSGGVNSFGTVVEFPVGGPPNTALATFTGGAGGQFPGGRLLVDASGNLFGTTLSGGANNAGTVFEIKKTGGVYATTPTVLTSFGSGIVPSGLGNLVEDGAGNLFGTTTTSVFEVQKTASGYNVPVALVPFDVGTQIGSLTIDAAGDIFGTTISGGADDNGTVFEIHKTATGYADTPTTLASFTAADGKLNLNRPKTLIVDANGDLFGTTDPSSMNSGGVVFEIVRTTTGYDGTPRIVVNGAANAGFGANLVADASGNLYGTTQTGGTNNTGTVFEITGSGFATTPTIVPVISNLLWQNASTGQAAVWEMDATTRIGGGGVTGSPGPAWTAVGTGAFFTGDTSDILWRNASTGQTAVWEMDKNIRTGGGPVTGSPGSDWTAIGTGDFNGDGHSDILWQNTTTGQASVWEMNGKTKIGGGAVTTTPGTAWTAVGTGDFNNDGNADILWQNQSTGQVSIWEMDGNTRTGGGPVTPIPSASWHAVGTGDFNQDGFSDILFQNAGTGQISIWEMNGTDRMGGGPVTPIPAASWHAIGTGAGGSDILFQNANTAQVSIWEMDGTNRMGGGPVTPIPGVAWKAIDLT